MRKCNTICREMMMVRVREYVLVSGVEKAVSEVYWAGRER